MQSIPNPSPYKLCCRSVPDLLDKQVVEFNYVAGLKQQ